MYISTEPIWESEKVRQDTEGFVLLEDLQYDLIFANCILGKNYYKMKKYMSKPVSYTCEILNLHKWSVFWGNRN